MGTKVLAGAVAGFVSAFAVDLHAFKAWKSVEEFTRYDWKTAAFRWALGAVMGAVSAMGLGDL